MEVPRFGGVAGVSHPPHPQIWALPCEISETQQELMPDNKLDGNMDEFMKHALEEARKGLREGGIPIGSILVKDDQICGRGHNQRVQENNPIMHAEIHCLQDAGRVGSYQDMVLYSTLMPCYLCAGAVVQFGIKKVIAGESQTFPGARKFMEQHGVEVIDLDLDACKQMMAEFIDSHPDLWDEDIGKL